MTSTVAAVLVWLSILPAVIATIQLIARAGRIPSEARTFEQTRPPGRVFETMPTVTGRHPMIQIPTNKETTSP